MGFLDKIRGAIGRSSQDELDEDWSFVAQEARSPSGEYLLQWFDGSLELGVGGAREEGLGPYKLLRGDEELVSGALERPNDGHVADNGSFVLADWGFDSDMRGTLYAFSRTGEVLIRHPFNANPGSTAISPDGSHALVETCYSDDREDSGVIACFSLADRRLLAKAALLPSWQRTPRFSDDSSRILLEIQGLGEFAATLDGRFIDDDRLVEAAAKSNDLHCLADLAHAVVESEAQIDAALAAQLLDNIERATKKPSDSAMNEYERAPRAQILRAAGEVCERLLEDPTRTLSFFDRALALDPKVGVKRRAAALRKKLMVEG